LEQRWLEQLFENQKAKEKEAKKAKEIKETEE
jgi:hypothetical protein